MIDKILKEFDNFEQERCDLNGAEAEEIKAFIKARLTSLLDSAIREIEEGKNNKYKFAHEDKIHCQAKDEDIEVIRKLKE